MTAQDANHRTVPQVYTLLLMNESKSSWSAHFEFVKEVYAANGDKGALTT